MIFTGEKKQVTSQDLQASVFPVVIFYIIGVAMVKTKGLEDELGFYGMYHTEPMNQLIHFIFIPCIWWSVCVFMCYVPCLPLKILGVEKICNHTISWGTIQLLAYSIFYIKLDVFAGSITSMLLFLFYMQASSAVAVEKEEEIYAKAAEAKDSKKKTKKMSWFKFAFILHGLSWYMQIHPGHKIYEGVKPALMDSLGQALGVAPMFAFLEGVWFLGLLPDMKARVLALVAENRDAMCAAGKMMPWCT